MGGSNLHLLVFDMLATARDTGIPGHFGIVRKKEGEEVFIGAFTSQGLTQLVNPQTRDRKVFGSAGVSMLEAFQLAFSGGDQSVLTLSNLDFFNNAINCETDEDFRALVQKHVR